jgi:hypothetical protein
MWVKNMNGTIVRADKINPNTLCTKCNGTRLDCPVCNGASVPKRKQKLIKTKIERIYNDIKKRLVTIFSSQNSKN